MSCTTQWEYEVKPGGTITYDESTVGYDDASFDGLPLYYNTVGTASTWFYEDAIDNCTPENYTFQDGTDFQFQDGTSFEF